MLLRQRIAVDYVLPVAKRRVQDPGDDESETYEGELKAAIESVIEPS